MLESVHRTGDAAVTVTDFLAVAGDGDPAGPLAARHLLVRVVRATGGTADVRIGIDARPGYARETARWRPDGDGTWVHEEPRLWAAADRPLLRSGSVLGIETSLGPGEGFAVVLGYADAPRRAVGVRRAGELLRATRTAWETWSSQGDDIGTGLAHVRRSALVLRGLMYDESGALVAAPTTSLPETIGGERNWDYRYTWHRDAALTVLALFRLGHADEGVRYMRFLLHECVSGSGRLRPMAGHQGRAGGGGGRPRPSGGVRGLAALLRRYVDTVSTLWREPDHGVWEIRGPLRHYVGSKVMTWVCLDRGVRLAGLLGDESAPAHRWRRAAARSCSAPSSWSPRWGRRDGSSRPARLCAEAGPLGLFSEEMAPDGTALGNYPQAFTHLGLIEVAANLDMAGSREALHQWATGRSQGRSGS